MKCNSRDYMSRSVYINARDHWTREELVRPSKCNMMNCRTRGCTFDQGNITNREYKTIDFRTRKWSLYTLVNIIQGIT